MKFLKGILHGLKTACLVVALFFLLCLGWLLGAKYPD